MERARFWEIVEAAGATTPEGCARLTEQLTGLTPEEIVGFDRHFDELFVAADRWDLWGAAYVIGGGCSDDGFADFRGWLVAAGREVYELALRDPDALAGVPDAAEEECFCELVLYATSRAYEAKTGEPLPDNDVPAGATVGEDWDFEDTDEMRRRYPRLCELVDW